MKIKKHNLKTDSANEGLAPGVESIAGDKEKTTSEHAAEALKLIAAMTPEQKKFFSREIGKGFSDEMNRVNKRTARTNEP